MERANVGRIPGKTTGAPPSIPRMPSLELLNSLCPFKPVPECPQILARSSSGVFALWEAWEKEARQECPVPFWAVVWPAARILAAHLLDNPGLVKDREVIEIGCGGAVVAIAAGKAGAGTVTANDIDPIALAIARQNAIRNRMNIFLDGRNRIETRSVDHDRVILISDFFYTRSESHALAALLSVWREHGATILIGDGGRAFVPADFREILREEWVEVDSDLEGKEKRMVRILRY